VESTITQNGALYALQHGAPKKYRRLRPKRVGGDPFRALPTLITSLDWFRMGPIPADKAQSREVTLEELRGLHFAHPFDQVAGLLSPQL
jgi:hypothetical protein